jgi:hypothetical protein
MGLRIQILLTLSFDNLCNTGVTVNTNGTAERRCLVALEQLWLVSSENNYTQGKAVRRRDRFCESSTTLRLERFQVTVED